MVVVAVVAVVLGFWQVNSGYQTLRSCFVEVGTATLSTDKGWRITHVPPFTRGLVRAPAVDPARRGGRGVVEEAMAAGMRWRKGWDGGSDGESSNQLFRSGLFERSIP